MLLLGSLAFFDLVNTQPKRLYLHGDELFRALLYELRHCRATDDTVTFEVDDEEYCFNRADIGDALMEIVVGDFVEIDFKNGKHIAIRTATQLG